MRFFLSLLLVLIVVIAGVQSKESIQISKLTRTISVESQVNKQDIELQFENVGATAINSIRYSIPASLKSKIAWFSAGEDRQQLSPLTIEAHEDKLERNGVEYYEYSIQLNEPLEGSGITTVFVQLKLLHTLRPLPETLKQGESQFVLFEGDSMTVFSRYPVLKQRTTVQLPKNAEIVSYTGEPRVSGEKLVWTFKESETPSYDFQPMQVHFAFAFPMTVARSVRKDIEVSHWGNVAVEEHYDIEHTGARLVGEWSRLDYQMNPSGTNQVVERFYKRLDQDAHDIYYRDDIGNISTTRLIGEEGARSLEITPRFPLFGGWKVSFYMGWNLPLERYLQRSGDLYTLSIPFGIQILKDELVADDMWVRVILPEGAKDIQYSLPFSVDEEHRDTHFTYLDVTGRPVLLLRKRNVVGIHNLNIQVQYRFSGINLIFEPLYLSAGFFVVLLSTIVFRRLNFSV